MTVFVAGCFLAACSSGDTGESVPEQPATVSSIEPEVELETWLIRCPDGTERNAFVVAFENEQEAFDHYCTPT